MEVFAGPLSVDAMRQVRSKHPEIGRVQIPHRFQSMMGKGLRATLSDHVSTGLIDQERSDKICSAGFGHLPHLLKNTAEMGILLVLEIKHKPILGRIKLTERGADSPKQLEKRNV